MTSESRLEIERAAGVPLDNFIEQCVSFAPKLRLIFEQNKYPIIDTDDKTPEIVAREVVHAILNSGGQNLTDLQNSVCSSVEGSRSSRPNVHYTKTLERK